METDEAPPKGALAAILGVSLGALAFLFWLLYFRGTPAQVQGASWLPALNATLNSLSALSLVLGLRAIKAGRKSAHRLRMQAAFVFSSLFLVSYIVYHSLHGETRFPGQGWIRPVYFFILISHVSLSMVVLPLVLLTFYLSLSGRFPMHRRVARWTFPLWLYVSVTGVLVFLFLRAYS